jgi:hypothetical protein
MAITVVERWFRQPQVLEPAQAQPTWRIRADAVAFVRAYFSIDRTRLACVYEAPDARAVELSYRAAGLDFDRAWEARMFRELMGLPPLDAVGDRATVVVERSYERPTPLAVVAAQSDAARWCFDANDIDLVDSFMRADGTGSMCVYAAPDAESVRRASRTVHFSFDVAWAATVLEPPAAASTGM